MEYYNECKFDLKWAQLYVPLSVCVRVSVANQMKKKVRSFVSLFFLSSENDNLCESHFIC